ncbi:MAG: tryptophan synthase subunit alpha [Thermoleophilia bacterium]|nr:tryptophan synthase subunit alpha [Thermoleophilia bacterium]
MSRLQELFKDRGQKTLLMPYTTGGFPNMPECRLILEAFIRGGADMIELGVPFSDPLADGPVVQSSTRQALQQGIIPDDVFGLAREFSSRLPVVLLVYYNSVFSYGQEKFAAAAADAGVDGIIVPDLPVDEADEFIETCRGHGVDPVLLVAPTTPDSRIAMVAEKASGFIYCVSVAGVTGARASLDEQLPDFLGRVRKQTNIPLAVGFGVSEPEHAAVVAQYADGVIIGSRLIKMVSDAESIETACREIEMFLRDVNQVLA